MKKLTLVLTTLMALPATLSCATAKPKTFFQRVTAHSGKIICGVCALIVGYFLFRKPAQVQQPTQRPVQQPAAKPTPLTPVAQDDPWAFQREKHQRHLAQQAQKAAAERPAPQPAPEPSVPAPRNHSKPQSLANDDEVESQR